MKQRLNSICYYFEFITTLFINEYKIQYKSKFSALIWIIIFPLLTIYSIYFFLSFFTKINLKHYNLIFLAGFIPWQFLAYSLTNTIHSIKSNADIIKKICFPYIVLPITSLLHCLIPFLISLVFFIVLIYINGFVLSLAAGFKLILIFIILFTMVLGLSLTLCSLVIFTKELQHILNIWLSIIFYACPILYPVSFIPKKFTILYLANPIASVITVFRNTLLPQQTFPAAALLYSLLFSLSILIIGINIFNQRKQYFADCI